MKVEVVSVCVGGGREAKAPDLQWYLDVCVNGLFARRTCYFPTALKPLNEAFKEVLINFTA